MVKTSKMWISAFLIVYAVAFASSQKTSLSGQVTTNCRVVPVTTTRNGDSVGWRECGQIEQEMWDQDTMSNTRRTGACRWQSGGLGGVSVCLCPANIDTCTANGRDSCYWHREPGTGATTCISNAERFYNQLARLLLRRGKKDFSMKIQYGSSPARGELPMGIYGPARIGGGTQNSLPFMPGKWMPGMMGMGGYPPKKGMYGGYGGYGGYGASYGGGYGQGGYGSSYGGGYGQPYGGYGMSYGQGGGYGPSYGSTPAYGQTSYPSQPGHPAQSQAATYPSQPAGYPPQPQGYPPHPTGYPPQPASYPPQPQQPQSAGPVLPQPYPPQGQPQPQPDPYQPQPQQPYQPQQQQPQQPYQPQQQQPQQPYQPQQQQQAPYSSAGAASASI